MLRSNKHFIDDVKISYNTIAENCQFQFAPHISEVECGAVAGGMTLASSRYLMETEQCGY